MVESFFFEHSVLEYKTETTFASEVIIGFDRFADRKVKRKRSSTCRALFTDAKNTPHRKQGLQSREEESSRWKTFLW